MELKLERKGLEKKFYELCLQVVEEQGLDLYGLDYVNGQNLLRLYVENPETKTAQLEDCAKVDRALTPFFETEEWMPEEVTLEVSSPGVYRDVKEAYHFEHLVGERLALTLSNKLTTEDILQGSVTAAEKKLLKDKKITVYLAGFSEEGLEVSAEKESKNVLRIQLENIKRANVEPLWDDIKEH